MASSIVSQYRDVLRKKGKIEKEQSLSDQDLALEIYQSLRNKGYDVNAFVEKRGDEGFFPLIRESYGEDKTLLGGTIDSMQKRLASKAQGLKQGGAVLAGSVGMDDTARDLMRSARSSSREVSRESKEVFDDYTMIDGFDDFAQYVAHGAASGAVEIPISIVQAFLGRGVGKQVQKGIEKSGKLEELQKKAKKYLGDDYGANVGMGAGALGGSALENTGHVYGDLYEYTKLDPKDEMYLSPSDARAMSMLSGTAAGILDSALPVYLTSKLAKKIGVKPAEAEVAKMFKSMPDGMALLAKGAGGEGVTEALQEALQMLTVKYHTGEEWRDEDWQRMINGGFLGAIGGGTVTGGTAVISDMLSPKPIGDEEIAQAEADDALDTIKERVEIRNRGEAKRFAELNQAGLGAVVSPSGSGRLGRIVELNEEDNTAVVEFVNGVTKSYKPTELNIKEGKQKIFKEEDLAKLSNEKLEEVKTLMPRLTKKVIAEQERRRNTEEDENGLKVLDTKLEVKIDKNNQLIVSDVISKERIYSATLREEDSILYLENENADSTIDQRRTQSSELVRKKAKAKAREMSMPISIDGQVTYPLTTEDVDQIDNKEELIVEFAKLQALTRSATNQAVIDSTTDVSNAIIKRLIDQQVISLNKNNKPILGKLEPKKGVSSKLITEKPDIGRLIAGSIFSELEGRLENYNETVSSANLTDKFILGEAKDLAVELTEEIKGINKNDQLRIAQAATQIFKEHHLDKDGNWAKGKTKKDIQDDKDLELLAQQQREQDAKTRFESLDLKANDFVQLKKGGELIKITEVDEKNHKVKLEGGDTFMLANSILRKTNERAVKVGEELVTELSNGLYTKKVKVSGKDTNYEHKGSKSLSLFFNENGKIARVKDQNENSYSLSDEIDLDTENLTEYLARLTLPETPSQSSTPVVKPVKLADNIYRKGSDVTSFEYEVKGKKKIGKFDTTPILLDGKVQGVEFDGETYDFDAPVEPSQWVEATRSLLKKKKLWGRSENRVQTPKRQYIKPDNSLVFTRRNNKPFNPGKVELIRAEEGEDIFDLSKKVKTTESSSTKAAVALRYTYDDGKESVLVRRLGKSPGKDGRYVIYDMAGKSGIAPLEGKKLSLTISTDEDMLIDAEDEESQDRIEVLGVMQFDSEVKVNANFDSEDAFEAAMNPYLDSSLIRANPKDVLEDIDQKIVETENPEVEQSLIEQKKRIEVATKDESGEFNPLISVYNNNIPDSEVDSFKGAVKKLATSIEDKEVKELANKIAKSDDFRVFDLQKFLGAIAPKKNSWKSGMQRMNEDGDYQNIEETIDLMAKESAIGQYKPRVKKGEGDVMNRVLKFTDETSEIKGDGKTEDVTIEDADNYSEDAERENIGDSESKLDFDTEDQEVTTPGTEEDIAEYESERDVEIEKNKFSTEVRTDGNVKIDEQSVELVEGIIADDSFPDKLRKDLANKVKLHKTGQLPADALVSTAMSMYQNHINRHQSVGDIAYTQQDLEDQIKLEQSELRSPKINKLPIPQGLVEENDAAVQRHLGGAKVDGGPIRLSAFLSKLPDFLKGSTELDGALVDMAQTLLSHPFTRSLKVEFTSWDNFKNFVENDGSNGKLTRAFVRGNNIVMGPFFKLPGSDLSADASLQITLLEEVAHRVLGTAIEAGIQAKRKGELPKGVSKVMSKRQAIKMYDETKELMDWLRTETDGKYYHGLLNMHEFWANFASNPRFRKFLNRPMPPAMRRKFSSRFERVIDWVLDLVSKIFDVDFTPNRTASDIIRKRYRTLLRTSDKLAKADLDIYAKIQLYHESQARRSTQIPVPLPLEIRTASEGTTEEAAASIARGSLQAGGRDQAGFQVEEQALREWAKENDLMLDAEEFDSKVSDKGGLEHEIYYDEDKGIWVKANDLSNHSSYLEYFNRLQISNYIFPEAPMKLQGFIERDGMLMPVVHQVHVKGSRPTEAEIRKFFEENGFKKVASPTRENDYENDLFEITDAHDENVKKLPNGQLVVIDVVPFHKESISNTGASSKFKQFLKAPKLSREEIEAMGGRFESADSINQQEEQSVAQGTLRAHMAALKDLGNVAESALSRVGETTLSSERVKDFTTFDRGITPETVGKVLKEKQLSIQEMQSQFAEATSPEVNIADANNINELETTANRDTGARNLLNMLTKARRGAVDILNTAKKEQTRASEKMTYLKAEMDRLSSTKTMFDAGKTQGIFEKFIKSALYNKNSNGESSKVNTFELTLMAQGKDIKPTPFDKLKEAEIDPQKIYTLMERLAEGVEDIKVIEQLTAEEIFDTIDIKASDLGIKDSDLDQAAQMAVALMLGSDQRNDVARSSFAVRLRLAKGQISHETQDAVQLIKAAARGEATREVKDKSMKMILNSVRKMSEDLKENQEDLETANEELRVAEAFVEAYDDRIADLDEFFLTSQPVELREGANIKTLTLDKDGKMVEDDIVFRLGAGESSQESKFMAARASELIKIMDTDEYKATYAGTPMDRYFKQLARELRKPNFGIQYVTANVGFLQAAAQSIQARFANLGPAGKVVSSLINAYTRDYAGESAKIFNQGRRVSKAMTRLHSEMKLDKGENLNQFIKTFGDRVFDWLNERPDLAGEEEFAINKLWADLKKADPTREYTEDGRKALRAYLKQWSIQNENFRKLYEKYDIKIEDEAVAREQIATGEYGDVLFRRFVDQGIVTAPRRLNRSRVTQVAQLLDAGFQDDNYRITEDDESFFSKAMVSIKEAEAKGVDLVESFKQIMGKSVSDELADMFFRPFFTGKSAHNTPFTLTTETDQGKQTRIVLPEEMYRAWSQAKGNNPGVRVANAIQNVVDLLPDADEATLSNLLGQFKHRANAILRAENDARNEQTALSNESSLSQMLNGSEFHDSIHARNFYNVLPGEFFSYQTYDETSSGQLLSKLMMTAHFGRKGEKLTDNYQAIIDDYEPSWNLYSDLSESIGLPIKKNSMPSKVAFKAYATRKKKMKEELARRGYPASDFEKLELRAASYVEAQKAMAAASAALTSRSSYNADLSLGLDALRTLAFGLVNTIKGAWTATMSIPDIVKVLGLNASAFRTLGGAYGNLAREVAGSFLESFGVEMVRPNKYNEELSEIYGYEEGIMSFSEKMTEIGVEGTVQGTLQGKIRQLRNLAQALSTLGASRRVKTGRNFVPGSLLTPITAPFTYLAQATNKSISLAMANTIDRFVVKTVEALETKGITLDNNTFEIKPEDIGYKDGKLDAYIFGNMDMINKLNQRLTAEGMSFTQLAQDFRRRLQVDPNAKVLTKDAVRAAYNIAMSEVTYDTMSGKSGLMQSGIGQWVSPLVGWSVSSANKGFEQMRNKEGRLAMRESIRYMLTSTAWLMPVGIAFTLFMDWWDEELLGKPSSLRKVPPTAALPGIGTFLAMADPRFEMSAMLERSMRANNILGIVQEFATPMLIGQLDPSSLGAKFDPTRRILGISTVMNAYAVATNYINALRTSEGKLEDAIPDYATVIRPTLYLVGLNSVVQNAQMLTNLTDAEDYDPTGFLSNERQVADITGMRNSLRVFAKSLGMEMRRGGLMQFSTTAMSNAIRRMERAAYANDKESFKEAYRKAVMLSEKPDPRKDVMEQFKRRNIRANITRFSLTDSDMGAMLSVMDRDQSTAIKKAMRNHDFYLRSIGGTPSVPRSNIKHYKEELRRLAL